MPQSSNIQLGLKENWRQFTLLVLVNAFVGGMVGLERSIFPQLAEEVFGVASQSAMLSFIAAFGLSKAAANYFTGKLANRFGRKNLLVAGWLLALPVPVILMEAGQWHWVVAANLLLGASQGLAWSSTVVMKIDLVGEKNRGLAMGLNEFAGYLAVGLVAFLTAYVASHYGLRPYPFYLGIGMALLGLLVSAVWVHDTRHFVHREAQSGRAPLPGNVFWQTTFGNKTLSAVTQAGLVNNLNDGMMWGLFPVLLANMGHSTQTVGLLAGVYPVVWGVGQLFTGKMSDKYSKKAMLFWGMAVQGLALLAMPFAPAVAAQLGLAAALGLGTALVYPTFLVAIAQATAPQQRAESVGVFRLWRDMGYAFGALLAGLAADLLGIGAAIVLVGLLTLASALLLQLRMDDTPRPQR